MVLYATWKRGAGHKQTYRAVPQLVRGLNRAEDLGKRERGFSELTVRGGRRMPACRKMGYCHFSAKSALIACKLACYPNKGISLRIINLNQTKALSQNSKIPYTC